MLLEYVPSGSGSTTTWHRARVRADITCSGMRAAAVVLLLALGSSVVHAQSEVGATVTSQRRQVEHIRIASPLPFATVKTKLESVLKRYDGSAAALVNRGETARARRELEKLAEPTGLTILQSLDHGMALAMVDGRRNAIQYGIGNVLMATEVTRHALSAGLYAPIRVILYEGPSGNAVFEYDKPSTSFAAIDNNAVKEVALRLDGMLQKVLLDVSVGPDGDLQPASRNHR